MGETFLGFSWNLEGISVRSDEFWRENIRGGWATILVLFLIITCQSLRALTAIIRRSRSVPVSPAAADHQGIGGSNRAVVVVDDSQLRISEIVSDDDLRNLIKDLDEDSQENLKWDSVVQKSNNLMSYTVKSCKPKDGPLKYLSATVFEDCSPEMLRDFYMDNEYRKQWDNMIVENEQLQVDGVNGTEIGRTVKKFPFLSPREYVLAWRVWEGKDKTFYCLTKECEHALAPKQRKYVRVGFFRSGWRIKKIPGRNACEIKMIHQEDAGLNAEMAKLAFSKGIWRYVCKMDAALRKFKSMSIPRSNSVMTAVTLMQKVPPELDNMNETTDDSRPESSPISTSGREIKQKKLSRWPSKTVILGNSLLVLGGAVCLCRGHSSLGTKLAVACILKKLTKHGSTSGQVGS